MYKKGYVKKETPKVFLSKEFKNIPLMMRIFFYCIYFIK